MLSQLAELPFLWLNAIPLGHTHTHVCIYHIFLSHSFICRNLGCFCILLLWIALQWTLKCRYLFKILSVPLDIYPEVGLPDHMVILFLILWGTSLLVSIATTAVYMPARYKGSLYSASWPTLISYLFDNPNKREVVSHCGFNVPFSAKWCWASFHVPVAPLFIFVRLHILCLYLLFFIFYFIIIIIFYFTILCWFCHTSTWTCHGCTHVPNA